MTAWAQPICVTQHYQTTRNERASGRASI